MESVLSGSAPTSRDPSRSAALLLVGHGSHESADSSRPVHTVAEGLRETGGFSEVRVGFWKEDPHLSRALDLVESEDVVVVPIFTSVGYFTDRVVPRELGLDGRVTFRGGRTIRYAAPVGTHRLMDSIVLERAREAAPLSRAEEAAAILVVVGHGTDAHASSGDTTRALAQRLGASGPFARVLPAFLDQDPRLEDVVEDLSGTVLLVPFFISEGWHAGTTIPATLGVGEARAKRGEATLIYSQAVGTHPLLVDVARELADQAAKWEVESEGSDVGRGVSREALDRAKWGFLRWVSKGGWEGKRVLQTIVRASRDGGFEIRHVDDADRPPSELEDRWDLDRAVDVAAIAADGAHRPLKTAPNLAPGWRFPRLGLDDVWEVYAHLYPTVPVHEQLALQGVLPITTFAESASRQSGMYEEVGSLGPEGIARVVERCCSNERCLRHPTWWDASREGLDDGDRRLHEDLRSEEGAEEDLAVPCPEPCSLLLSEARREKRSAK